MGAERTRPAFPKMGVPSQQRTFGILRRVAVADALDLGDLVHRPPFGGLLDIGRVERSPGILRVDR
jgi:hypothetical protein